MNAKTYTGHIQLMDDGTYKVTVGYSYYNEAQGGFMQGFDHHHAKGLGSFIEAKSRLLSWFPEMQLTNEHEGKFWHYMFDEAAPVLSFDEKLANLNAYLRDNPDAIKNINIR